MIPGSGLLAGTQENLLSVGIAIAFSLVGVLGHLGYRHKPARWVYYGILGLIVLGCFGLSGVTGLVYVLMQLEPKSFPTENVDEFRAIFVLAPCLLLTGVLGALVLIPPTRRWFYSIFPGNPESLLHPFGLIASMLILSLQIFTLRTLTPEKIRAMLHETNFFFSTSLMQSMLILVTVAGVGLGISKTRAETMERLGIRALSWKQVALCILGALLLFGLVSLIEVQWLIPLSPKSAELGKEMMEAVQLHQTVPIAVIVFLGLSLLVGTGEELFFRGLLQPAVGMILSSLLFAFIHTQYGFTPVIFILFLLSMGFGLVRQRYGVIAAILVHCFYDFFNFMHIQRF